MAVKSSDIPERGSAIKSLNQEATEIFEGASPAKFKKTVEMPDLGPGEMLLYLQGKQASIRTVEGALFTREHPYQVVSADEGKFLLKTDPETFRGAQPSEVVEFYDK